MKYQVKLIFADGEEIIDDTLCDTYDEAVDYSDYLVSCYQTGAETLNMSNMGDYEYDEDNFELPDCEIIEVDE
ncbi:MAG: hypothetical protein IJM91_07690 [Lachnospiraceae bacterium]|nr:hypothetical protein [Lachnospiraceae bacterium]